MPGSLSPSLLGSMPGGVPGNLLPTLLGPKPGCFRRTFPGLGLGVLIAMLPGLTGAGLTCAGSLGATAGLGALVTAGLGAGATG